MRIANTVFFFPWWGLLLLAVSPPALAAAAAFPLRRFIPYSDAVVDARTKLILLGISAYTFTVAFSVNTLWYQDIELGNAALSFDYSVSVLKDAAQEHADDLPAGIGERIEALRQPDVIVEVVSVLPRANQTFSQVWGELTGGWDELDGAWAQAPAAVGTELKAHAKDAERAFMQLSRSANSPGVPGIILIVIVLLGMVLSGVMAAAPRSARPSRREAIAVDWLMVAGVVIIGLTQWSLWVLNSKDFVLSMILPYFSTEFKTLTGFHMVVGAFVLVVPLLVVLGATVVLRNRSRRRGVGDVGPDAGVPIATEQDD